MINQQLLDYIKQQSKEGIAEGDIKKALLQSGWNEVDIDAAFSSFGAPIAPTPSPATTVPAQQNSPAKPNLSENAEDNTQMNVQRQLHPKAVWLFFLNRIGVWILAAILLASQSAFMFDSFWKTTANISSAPFLILFLFVFIVILILAFVVAKLTYHFYKFELTDGEYKAERGIIWKRYISIPYGRIQNVDIYRGLLSRLLGLSDLDIQTAGYSSGKSGASEGKLPGLGVQEAEEVREALIKKANEAKQGV